MSSVSKVNTTLVSTLVAAVLQAYNTLASPQLLLGKVTNIFVRLFGSDTWFAIVPSLSTERLQTNHNGIKVLPLPEIDGLEGLLSWDAECPRGFQEGVYIFHALECEASFVNFLHRPVFDIVYQFAKKHPVPQGLVKIVHVPSCAYILARDRFYPFQTFLRQFLAVFTVNEFQRPQIP